MKVVLDMNLSPSWIEYLRQSGVDAEHWSSIGRPDAPDAAIMEYADLHGAIVLTHDLDFSAILAASGQRRPSVMQIRSALLRPDQIGQQVVGALLQMQAELEAGALVTVDVERTRIRLLPFRRSNRDTP